MLLLGCVKIRSDKILILRIASFPVRLSQNSVPAMFYINGGSGLICLFLASMVEACVGLTVIFA